MIKNKSNISEAIKSLQTNSNNAVVSIFKDAAFGSGLLNGATITFKDNYAFANTETKASSKILEGFVPGYNATVVSKIQDQGGAIVAKVHLDELSLGGTGTFSAYGLIKNPLDETRMAGGSSSGSVATLNEHITLAMGSDTGDSIRLPASYVGKYGYKPSYGAISRYGLFPYASSLDTVGYLAHNLDDIITMSNVLFGQDEKDMTSKEVEVPSFEELKPKKVGIITNIKNLANSYIQNDYDKFIKKLQNDNVDVVEITLDQKLLDALTGVYQVISFSEVSSNDSNLTGIPFGNRVDGNGWDEIMHNTRSKHLGQMVQRRFTLGSFYTLSENQIEIFSRAQKIRRLIVNMFNEALKDVDLIAAPATRIAPKISGSKSDDWFTDYLIHANLSGSPSLVIPFSKHEGMPYGLELFSKIYQDKPLLSYAKYIDNMIGGHHE